MKLTDRSLNELVEARRHLGGIGDVPPDQADADKARHHVERAAFHHREAQRREKLAAETIEYLIDIIDHELPDSPLLDEADHASAYYLREGIERAKQFVAELRGRT